MKKISIFVFFAVLLTSVTLVTNTNANTVGDIQVVYYAPNSFGISSTLDAPAFVFQNTSTFNITNGVFSIGVGGDNATADSFKVGTVNAGSYVVVVPGTSNDGGSGHTFFSFTGSPLDTSDSGPNSDSVPFSFTGMWNGTSVSTGTFTPAATRRQSNDGTESINFLGNQDANCNNCFGPVQVASINTPVSTAPDQGSTLVLFGISVVFLAGANVRRFAKT